MPCEDGKRLPLEMAINPMHRKMRPVDRLGRCHVQTRMMAWSMTVVLTILGLYQKRRK